MINKESNLVSMCLECKRIRIGDNLWIDKTHPMYEALSRRSNISDGYCPQHVHNNQLYKQFQFRKEIYTTIEKALLG